MSDAENNPTPAAETVDWKERYEDLSRQTAMLRVAVLVGSLVLTAYLFVQKSRVTKDVESLRPELKKVQDQSNKDNASLQAFASKLVDYGNAHPEFSPILNKYGIKPVVTNRPPGGPGLQPPPAAPPKK